MDTHFDPFWLVIVVPSLPACPDSRTRPGGLISPDNRFTPPLPVTIDFSRQKAKKIVGEEEVIAMSDPTGKLEQVDGYEVPVDPMDDLKCDSCQ